jgi:hypothetical protein
MTDLLLGLVGGLIVVVTALVTRFLTRRGASPSARTLDKATSKHDVLVEEVETILEGKTPEEGLAALINEKMK